MFLGLEKRDKNRMAVIDGDGHRLTYGDLLSFADEFEDAVGRRCLVGIITENCAGAFAGYVASMINHIVPIMLSHTLTQEALINMFELYHPGYLWMPAQKAESFGFPVCFSKYDYVLTKTQYEDFPLFEELSLLLPTSGSTGSPKLVRHSYQNVESNARTVAEVFELSEASIGMVSLPLNFTQGLNVATSHLAAGGTALLNRATLTDKAFWDMMREEHAQSFTGVPFSYEVLYRLQFFRMDLPDLKIINQGGGHMSDKLFRICAQYASDTGRKFIATYGSTETTSRMSYLPAEYALKKTGSIGKALPGRTLMIVDDKGRKIKKSREVGELVFSGPNVTLGYATKGEDLILGDERCGVYHTGDLAYQDDGWLFIVGRKKRFLKLYGFRVSLDDTENLIKTHLQIPCACIGDDKRMQIFVEEEGYEKHIPELLNQHFGIPQNVFCVRVIPSIPKNESGKTLYARLNEL